MLVELEDVKRKIGVPVGDESNDLLIGSALASANQRVLDRCGYSEAALTAHVEVKSNQRNDRTYLTDLRPVANLVVEGRPEYVTDFYELWVSLDDPANGVVTLIGATDFAWLALREAHGYGERLYTWPVVRYTYDVAAVADAVTADEYKALQDAVSSLTAWLLTQQLARGTTEQQINRIRQVLSQKSEPSWLWTPLARHFRDGERAEWV